MQIPSQQSSATIRAAAFVLFKKQFRASVKTYLVGALIFDILWVVLAVSGNAVAEIFFHILLAPWFVILWMFLRQLKKARAAFWREFAAARQWTYQEQCDPTKEIAAMFKQGHSQKILNCVSGTANGRETRMFDYVFTVGRGKHSTTHEYTVFVFRFQGRFPHMYLNYRDDYFRMWMDEDELPVPREFERDFHLYAPRKYEVEALAVFTPDIFQYLLDTKWSSDVELIDQEVVVYRRGHIEGLAQLEKDFGAAVAFMRRLAPKLDRFCFAKIGDYEHTL